jgi:hypothetical protein
MIGLGLNSGGICSAEELVNAVVAKKQAEEEFEKEKKDIESKKLAEMDNETKKMRKDAPAKVETVDELPW